MAASTTVTQPLLKSQPDMSKINSFETGMHVTVTKHQAPRGTPGTAVLPTQTMSRAELLDLQTKLPLVHGAGFYLFSVVDAGGSGEDSWMVRLGTEKDQQEGYPMAGPGFPSGPAAPMVPSAPLDGDVKQIMPGWFFNEALGLLSTPWRETIPWRQGEALPKPPTGATHLAAVPPTATPWGWQPPQQGGWGGYPISGGSSEIDALKAELAEANRRREMDELKAEQRRRDDEAASREKERIAEDRRREDQRLAREEQRRAEDQRRDEQRTKDMADLIAKLTAKPAGPSEHEQRIERELLEEKRRREDGEREAARREEDRRRDEQHRAELAVMNERVERTLREASATRTDPMMTVFKEVLISQQASAAATMQTMREASAATAAVAERNAITPQQVMEMVRTTRDGASESSKTVMETMRGLMKTQQEVMTSMIEIAGQGNQPWYAGAIQEGLNKVGMIGTAMAEQNAQKQAQQAEMQRLQAQQQAQQARMRAAAQVIVTPPPSAAPTPLRPVPAPSGRIAPTPPPPSPTPGLAGRAQHTGGRPEGTTYIQKRDVFILADGREVANAVVQEHGWGPVLAMAPYDEGAPKLPAGTAPAAAAPAPHVNGSRKKPRGRRAAAPAPVVEVVEAEVLPPAAAPPPPPANGQGYTLEELRDMEPDQIRLVVNPMEDPFLFGPLLPAIVDLRGRVAKGMTPDKAAESILGSRQYLSSFGGALPPAFELMMAEHYEVLVERLLPNSPDDYREAVAATIEEQIDAEGGGGEEEEETVQ
jgi:hypothetical protein